MLKRSTLVLAVMAAAGCGGQDGQTEATRPAPKASPASAQADPKVAIREFKFAPEATTVAVGASVTWTNDDTAPHTATADDGSFDTGDLRKGDTGTASFRKAGTYAYFCEFHRFMRGEVVVR